MTNDSRRTPSELVKKLQSLGFTVYEEEIYSPIPVVINTLLTLGLRPFLMVHPGIYVYILYFNTSHRKATFICSKLENNL